MSERPEDVAGQIDLVLLENLQAEHAALLERVKELEFELGRTQAENSLLWENRQLREMLLQQQDEEGHGHDHAH